MTEGTGTSVQDAPQTQQQSQQASVIDPARAELDRLMNIQMTARIPAEQSTHQQQEQNQQAEANQPAPGDQPTTTTDAFQVLKEKYGYDTIETAVKEIEDLRQFKAAPPVAEIKYENEKSQKIVKALQSGDYDGVYEALRQERALNSLTTAEVTEENAEAIIKLAMELKYKDQNLSPAEINYKFNKQYAIPKEPVMGDSELQEEFEQRKAAWEEQVADIKMSKIIDAKLARPELEKAKSKIVIPEVAASVDEGYIQYKKSLEEQPKIDAAMKEIYKPFTPKSIETKIKFIDEPNKIDFEFQHEPDVQGFEKAKEMALDSNKFLALFTLPNGDFDNVKYLDALYFAANKEAVLLEAIKQAKNATIKASLPDNSGGAQRQFPQSQQLGELDQAMLNAGIKKAS